VERGKAGRSGFLDRFFSLDMRVAKVVDFINLRHGNMSVMEYALRFTQLSKYNPYIVANRRTKMIKFVSGVSNLVVKECRTALLMHDMDISCLLVHSQQIDEEKLKERSRVAKRERTDDGNYSHSRSGGWGHLRFWQRFSGQVSSNAPQRSNNERVSNPKLQGDCNKSMIPTCAKCGRNHEGMCLAGFDACFGCGKMNQKIRNCPLVSKKEGDNLHRAQSNPSSGPSGSGASVPTQK